MVGHAGQGDGRQGGEDEGVEGDGGGVILRKGKFTQNGVQGIAKARTQPPQDGQAGHTLLTQREQSRDQHTPKKGEKQGEQLQARHLLVEEQRRHEDDEGRSGVQQNRRHRHGAGRDGAEITPAKKELGADARTHEVIEMPGVHLQLLGVGDRQKQAEDDCGGGIAGGHVLQRSEAHCVEKL